MRLTLCKTYVATLKGPCIMRLAGSLICLGFSAGFTAGAVNALEVPAPSRVDAVTVFLSGAEVTRVAKVKLDKGEHTIVFNDIPVGAVPGSIRVEGKATGKLDIGSVDTQRKLLARAESQAADVERKKLEDDIEALRDQKTIIEAQVQAAETQKVLIANLALLPSRPAPAAGPAGAAEDWPRILSTIAQGTTDASRLQIDAQLKIRDLDRRIDDLDKKLSSLIPAKTEQTEVKVNVDAGSPLEADLTIRYQVANANWAPIYDARLQTGSKTAPPKLSLARRAAITQKTGENWDNVTLQLSTARPSEGAAAPQIDTQVVEFEPEVKPMPAAPVARMERSKMRGVVDENKQDDALAEAEAVATAALEPPPEPITERIAALTPAPFEATFAVPAKVTVMATGEAKRVVLMSDELEPVLTSRTVPKVEPNAYLYAKLKFAKGTPLLPGRVYLFRDGTFVGTGDMPLLPPGVDHDLGFGVDDQVKVRFAVLEEKRGETGLISTSRTDSRNFRVTIKNLHERPIQLTVLDRVPVSLNQDIKVEYTGKATPTKQNVEDKRGVMSFEAKLEPDEEKVLEYGYRTSWPAAKSIIYGP